jgi:3-oxoacyl-[acyl-carrier-protein] synthase II
MTRPAPTSDRSIPRISSVVATAVTAWAVHVPGADGALPPERAGELLGRKGLLFKEPATRLALCAVHRALRLAPAHRPGGDPDPDVAVVACGNLGNVQTVVDVARTVAERGVKEVSVLAAPNASSNVIASTVGLWFRFGGPNLMVCSGATAGLDAVAVGARLLRAGRARRVVVVGAEPADDVARAVHGSAGGPATLRAGAACVVLAADGAADRGSLVVESVTDPTAWPRPPARVLGRPCDGGPDHYGAHGVVALATAAQALAAGAPGPLGVLCGDEADGWRAALIAAPAAATGVDR